MATGNKSDIQLSISGIGGVEFVAYTTPDVSSIHQLYFGRVPKHWILWHVRDFGIELENSAWGLYSGFGVQRDFIHLEHRLHRPRLLRKRTMKLDRKIFFISVFHM